MPYKSKAQEAYMHIHHPQIAKRWDEDYNTPKNLPEHVKGSEYSMSNIASLCQETANQVNNHFKIK